MVQTTYLGKFQEVVTQQDYDSWQRFSTNRISDNNFQEGRKLEEIVVFAFLQSHTWWLRRFGLSGGLGAPVPGQLFPFVFPQCSRISLLGGSELFLRLFNKSVPDNWYLREDEKRNRD